MEKKGKENMFPQVVQQEEEFAAVREEELAGVKKEDFAAMEEEDFAAMQEEDYADESEEEECGYASDSSIDPDFADSDYDFEAGDDTLFDENVDTSVPDDIIAVLGKR